jgi:glycosyltransferase involved in cell wall biosynthesis
VQTLIKAQLLSPYDGEFQLRLFDTSKRTRPDRWLVTGILSQARIFLELFWVLLRRRPEIVHIHVGGYPDPFRRGADALLGRILGRKVIFHVNSGDFDSTYAALSPMRRSAINAVFSACDRILATSDYWAGFYSNIVPRDRIKVVYNAIRSEPYATQLPSRSEARRVLGLPADAFVWLLLGVMGHRKGLFDICEAIPSLARTRSDVLFALVGPDENIEPGATDHLKRICSGSGVEGNALFPGEVDERGRVLWLAAADAFLLPSYNENSPLAILEAMAAGLPIVSTRVAAIPEVLQHGENAILIEPGNKPQLVDACVKIMCDGDLRGRMVQANRCRFAAKYDMDRAIAPQLAEEYRELLSRRSKS